MTPRRPHDPSRQPSPGLRPQWWVSGPEWATHGFRQPGWLLLPLRGFLGFTFVFAALQKLANPDFFNANSTASVQHQMLALAPSSPIGPLVQLSLHAGFLVGLLIALGELAVGVGTLLGFQARLAACGGALLALTFFLTVSWTTTPYYYGADIVFLFAWTPFITLGAGGVLSTDAWLRRREATPGRSAAHPQAETVHQRERRALLTIGTATVLIGAATAGIGRLVGGTGSVHTQALGASTTKTKRPSAPTTASPQAKHAAVPTGMTRIGSVSAVPVGQAGQFQDPANGAPAWLVRFGPDKYAAFSAVCTHAGCTVQYDAGNQEFVCPCHGGTFSARTGQVLAGPPPTPLPAIPMQVTNGQLYVK
ncbi:MAG: TQO small subunit DoxD [Nocardioidaceae bacterium]